MRDKDLKVKTLLIGLLLVGASILPFAIRAQGEYVDAGPNQTVYVGQEVKFNGSVFADLSLVVSIEWNFGDGSSR